MKWIIIFVVMAMPIIFLIYNKMIKGNRSIFYTVFLIIFTGILLKVKSLSEVMNDKDYIYSCLLSCFIMIIFIILRLLIKSPKK